jgi:hypothetical protein
VLTRLLARLNPARRPRAAPRVIKHAARYLPSRLRVHQRLVEDFVGRHTGIATDGLAAVATSGPPAVGKSTRLGELGYGAEWRRIDSDVFKLMLIEHDLHSGDLAVPDEVGDLVLADGEGIMPLEMSGLYHRESTVIADRAQEICMAARENVIVEGTLSWDGLAPRLVGDLVTHGYESLDVVLVEVPLETALDRAGAHSLVARTPEGRSRRPFHTRRDHPRSVPDRHCDHVRRQRSGPRREGASGPPRRETQVMNKDRCASASGVLTRSTCRGGGDLTQANTGAATRWPINQCHAFRPARDLLGRWPICEDSTHRLAAVANKECLWSSRGKTEGSCGVALGTSARSRSAASN